MAQRHKAGVLLRYTLRPRPGYPFSLALTVEYELRPEGLLVRTTATDIGPERCPFGNGAHPYLRLGSGTVDVLTLSAPGARYLRASARGLPQATEPVIGTEFDFRRPRTIGATRLDHAFCDLERDQDRRARVRLSEPDIRMGVTLWMDESFPYLMLFTGDALPDVARRSIAVEPMTCAPNAFRTGEGLVILEPGQSFTSEWGISPE